MCTEECGAYPLCLDVANWPNSGRAAPHTSFDDRQKFHTRPREPQARNLFRISISLAASEGSSAGSERMGHSDHRSTVGEDLPAFEELVCASVAPKIQCYFNLRFEMLKHVQHLTSTNTGVHSRGLTVFIPQKLVKQCNTSPSLSELFLKHVLGGVVN